MLGGHSLSIRPRPIPGAGGSGDETEISWHRAVPHHELPVPRCKMTSTHVTRAYVTNLGHIQVDQHQPLLIAHAFAKVFERSIAIKHTVGDVAPLTADRDCRMDVSSRQDRSVMLPPTPTEPRDCDEVAYAEICKRKVASVAGARPTTAPAAALFEVHKSSSSTRVL